MHGHITILKTIIIEHFKLNVPHKLNISLKCLKNKNFIFIFKQLIVNSTDSKIKIIKKHVEIYLELRRLTMSIYDFN